MGRFIDLTGQRFERLVVLRFVDKNQFRHSLWLCECDCGIEKIVLGYDLKSGHTKSCGCLQKEKASIVNTKHGHTKNGKLSKTWITWRGMTQRCVDIGHKQYKDYGGRGITVCRRWRNFVNFLKDMGEHPGKEYQIDRVDNDGNYCRENCRWATKKEQMRNTRQNRLITFEGKTRCLIEWAEEYRMSDGTLRSRFRLGWSIEKALTTPVRKKST